MLPIISAGVQNQATCTCVCAHTHTGSKDVHNSVCVWVSLLASVCVFGSQGHASETYG